MNPIVLKYINEIRIDRDKNGIPHVNADNEADLYFGQGYAQAMDRGMQMLLTRILGQGRASEFLDSSEELLQIDSFFRRMNWYGDAGLELSKINLSTRDIIKAYCEGINAFFQKSLPWEFKLLGYKPAKWRPEDSILLMRMTGYVTLQQSQTEMERLIVEMIQAGVEKDLLEELFPGQLGGLEMDLVKKITLGERIVPADVLWKNSLTRMMASNNWAVAGSKTASGKAILCNDPHLETNRLPNLWQEIVLKIKDRYLAGAGMPGLPGLLIGRNNDLAWGATYTFMDAVDSWVEECREGKFKRGSFLKTEWVRFQERREIIKRKKKPDHIATFYENEHGVLDGSPFTEGFYLATRWASGSHSGARSLENIFKMMNAKDVREGMELMGALEMSMNWVFADAGGNIGYQMSGILPKRRSGVSGLIPLPGWEEKNDWKGFVPFSQLPRVYNPPEGFIVTANNDLNHFGKAAPINLSMGPYRAERIANLLKSKIPLTPDYMPQIQYDVYSLQAERYMKILTPLLPHGDEADILRNWDFKYDLNSKGAWIFENFYRELLRDVVGPVFGHDVMDNLLGKTGIFVDFYSNFDAVLLSKKSGWFNKESRENIFRRALDRSLKMPIRSWGDRQNITMKHLLFGGKFPTFFGFDRGPVAVPGGRATPLQGQIYRSAGRETSFTPSFRMIIDFEKDGLKSNMAGGPSDRRFSQWYVSDLENWKKGKYKDVTP